MYRALFRVVLTRLDPEFAHTLAAWAIRALAATGLGFLIQRWTRPHPSLTVETLGHRFASPFGVAAGFDKNATLVRGLGQLGFSHVEVGTVTALPQPGNPRPRLFRLVEDRAVINRMGFNNSGGAAAVERLAARRGQPGIVGVNIGANKDSADRIGDYATMARLLAPYASYLAVNVS